MALASVRLWFANKKYIRWGGRVKDGCHRFTRILCILGRSNNLFMLAICWMVLLRPWIPRLPPISPAYQCVSQCFILSISRECIEYYDLCRSCHSISPHVTSTSTRVHTILVNLWQPSTTPPPHLIYFLLANQSLTDASAICCHTTKSILPW